MGHLSWILGSSCIEKFTHGKRGRAFKIKAMLWLNSRASLRLPRVNSLIHASPGFHDQNASESLPSPKGVKPPKRAPRPACV